MRYKDTDYLHAAARVSCLENKMLTEEDMLKAVDAEGVKEAYRILSGRKLFGKYDIDEYEQAFEDSLAEAYALIEEITGEIGLTDIFRYAIDGHNMKVMIKSAAVKGDFSRLYKKGGTVDPNVLEHKFNKNDYRDLPEIMGKAALEATEELAKTQDSQIVDILIDKAVMKLMAKKAVSLDFECVTEYVTDKIDFINIRSAMRMLRMKKDIYAASKVFAEGGNLNTSELEQAYLKGFDGLRKLTEKIPKSEKLCEAINIVKHGGSISGFEEQTDVYFRHYFKSLRTVSFGIEPAITYLFLKEQEVRACRLILVSKMYELPKEIISRKVRCIYADEDSGNR